MRLYGGQHRYYCGVLMGSKFINTCIIDRDGEVQVLKKIPARVEAFKCLVRPYRQSLAVACEGMFSWYWLADLCTDEKIVFVLGHGLYLRAMVGDKKQGRLDVREIASLLREGRLAQAYVYPKEKRAVRDMLRRRNHLAKKRSELITHVENTAIQNGLSCPLGSVVWPGGRRNLPTRFRDPAVRRMVEVDLATIDHYTNQLDTLGFELDTMARQHDPIGLDLIKSIPGINSILGLVMLYEVGDIRRFPKVQDFISYCRLVKSGRKVRGNDSSRHGNVHLNRAFVDAIALLVKGSNPILAVEQQLADKYGKGKAMGILTHRLGRTVYSMLKNQVPFDTERFLGKFSLL